MVERIAKGSLWLLGVIILLIVIKMPVQLEEEALYHWSLPLSGKRIVIDPGHGGPDGGAMAGGVSEKAIALAVSKQLRDYLQQAGAIVYMTRETDTDLASEHTKGLSNRKTEDIRNRIKFIEEQEAHFFVSIHLNSVPSAKWYGAQTFYHPQFDESKHLAKMIQSEIVRNMENTTRQALAMNHIYMLKHAPIPSALVEIGFLSNPKERSQLTDTNYQRKMANSIYLGILRYVTEQAEPE
ncbi:MAG TPA: N-acetylmuramoyl-L-alanine amidase CwlD [Bacillota bacterium]|nr:N-acetylmuramoyl-L-alanine amidase CwlD [Bacillota bacterium]